MKQTSSALTAKHRIGYGLGDFSGCLTFSLMTAFLTRYYVNVVRIDTAIIAVMTLIWKIFDAASNPVIGVFMDKAFARNSAQGKFRPWILRIFPLVTVSAILVFTAPGWVTGVSRLVVTFVTYLLYEMFYAIHNISLGGLISAMAKTDTERSELSSARGIGASLGNLVPMMVFPLIISAFEGNPALGYGLGAMVCSILGLVGSYFYHSFTEERNLEQMAVNTPPIRVSDIIEVFRVNRAFLALCLHGLLSGILMSVSSALGTYLFADVLGSITLMSFSFLLGIPASIFFMSLIPMLSRRIGMQKVLRLSLLLGAALYCALFAFHLVTTVNVWVHIFWSAVASGIANLSNSMQWGMLSQAIEYNETLTGKRTEGSINGTFNMLRRLGQGIGGSFGVALLGIIGYNATASVQTAGTILGIKVLCLLFPAFCAVGSWAVFRFIWNLSPKKIS